MAIKQEERKNIRLMTGQVNPDTGVVLPTTGCIPSQVQQSGQFTSFGTDVIGDGSSDFSKEFCANDWLYSASLNEVRKIKSVYNNRIGLENPFSANITVAEDVFKVRSNQYCVTVTKNVGGADALYQEVLFQDGEIEIRDFDLGGAPFTYNAQASTLSFSISE